MQCSRRRAARRLLVRGALGLLVIGVLSALAAWVAVTQPTLGGPPSAFPGSASAERLRADVEFLTGSVLPRNARHPDNLETVARHLEAELFAAGARVRSQGYEAFGARHRNIVASLGPEEGPVLVIGAHYDAFGPHPGADDNASGTAGLIELARLLATKPPRIRTELVAFTLEEPPAFGTADMGSTVHADSLREAGAEVVGMVSLEMIGYFSADQTWPSAALDLLYPSEGDFVMLVGRWEDGDLLHGLKRGMTGATATPVLSLRWWPVAGLDSSDHRSYWANGYTAVMLTDTAHLRNPNYHTAGDTADTLDYGRMAEIVEALASAIHHLQP